MFGASATHASPEVRSSAHTATGNAASLGKLSSTDRQQTFTATPMVASDILAQVPPPPPTPTEVPSTPPAPSTPETPATPATPSTPSNSETQDIKRELDTIKNQTEPGGDKFNSYQPKSSPAFSIFNDLMRKFCVANFEIAAYLVEMSAKTLK